MAPPEWTPPGWVNEQPAKFTRSSFEARLARATREALPAVPADFIERAAGTGLTGHSSQQFVPVAVGPLESEATVIRLRIVIGSDEALAAPRPLPESQEAPARPAARP